MGHGRSVFLSGASHFTQREATRNFYAGVCSQVREVIPTDLLMRLLRATPDQYSAIERVLGLCNDETCQSRLGTASSPPYQLRRGLGWWELALDRERGVIRDDRAMRLVVYLLKHPPVEAIHASVWENRVDGSPLLDGFGGIERGAEDDRPRAGVSEVGGVIEERTGRRFVGGDTLPALQHQLRELQGTLHDETLPADEREDARRELAALLRARARGGKLVGGAECAVDRVRKQVKTLIEKLKRAEVASGKPHLALRAFGWHLDAHLWRPSMGGKCRRGASGKPGCFTYEPPDGVVWTD